MARASAEDQAVVAEQTAGLRPLELRPVLVVAAALVAVELAVAARYGYHRDELYFLSAGHHLAWGYVDQPPFVPFVARLSTALFGSSVVALRLFPALAGGGAVVLTGLMARELGGGRRAQVLAALAAATSAQVLAIVHLLSTAAFDIFFWAAITLLVLRLLRTGDQRLWVAIGAVAGIGLLNKHNVLFLLGGLGVGLLWAKRDVLRGGWPWAGTAIALAIWSPNVAWNAHHHWAAVEMTRSLHRENASLGASIGFIPSQLLVVGPVLAPFWIAGLRRLMRGGFARPMAIAYLALLVVYTATGAKPYYLAGIYFVLFAAGAVWAEERLVARRRGLGWWPAAMIAGALIAIPLTLPVLPVSTLAKDDSQSKFNKDLSATVGWRRVVHQLAGVAATLPPAERAHVVIFTGDYGAAGAVDRFGGEVGLPHAISGHNNYWIWGPSGATDGATTIAVNLPKDYLQTIFGEVTPAGTVDNGHGVWTEERGAEIWICRRQKLSWARAWPRAKHYG